MTVSSPRPHAVPLPAAFRFLWSIILSLGVLSLGFCLLRARQTHQSPLHILLSVPSLAPFGDYTVYLHKFRFLHTLAFYTDGHPYTYPAPIAAAYHFFYSYTGPHQTRTFLVFLLLGLLVPALLFARVLAREGIQPFLACTFSLSLLILSSPAILVFMRGNMEILVWIVLVVATWAWVTGRANLASAAFALAAALKLFPFVFFGLFLSVRDFRRILLGAVVFLAVSVASLAWLGPTIPSAYAGVSSGLTFFRSHYMGTWQLIESTGDHSLFNLYKTTAVLAFHQSPTSFVPSLNRFLPVAALTGLALYVVRIRHLPLLNQLLCLTIASIYLTAFSGDGTLLHLYCPLALFLLFALGRARASLSVQPSLPVVLLLFALLLTPEPYLIASTRFGAIRIDGSVHALLLGILLLTALIVPFGPNLAESRRSKRTLLQSLLHPE